MSGIKIAKTGENVLTATDKELAYSSEYNVLKVVKEGIQNVSYTASSGSASVDIAHGLNFTPSYFAFVNTLTAGNKFISTGQPDLTNSEVNFVGLNGSADSTNLSLTISVSTLSSLYGSNQTFPLKYFIFGDTAREASTQTLFPSPLVTAGFKVSKSGKSIDSQYIEDYSIHSQMPSMKLHAQSSTSIVGPGLLTVSHDLGFAPAFLVMASYDNANFSLCYYKAQVSGPSNYGYSDSSNLYIRSFNVAGVTIYYKYIIFANPVDS